MIIPLSFSEQIIDWLVSSGFECKQQQEVYSVFPAIEIWKTNRFILELKLVTIEKWMANSESSIELLEYINRQGDLRENGIFSVILWEDLWLKKIEIVKSRLKSILGISYRIPARLTYAVRIYKNNAEEFLNRNHLQGSVSSKYRFGLYLPVRYFRVLPSDFQMHTIEKDLLVAVATFSHARIFQKNENPFRSYEFIRFANLPKLTVVGGLNKLLSAFTKEIHPDDIMTYVDLEWSDGAGYRKLGFEEISRKPPITFFLNSETNERFSLRNAQEGQKLVEICNAGSLKFVKTIKQKSFES